NYTHFIDKEFDVLYESALGETSQNKIEILYKKMDSLIINKSIIVPLFYDEVIRFTRKNLDGMQINAANLLDLRYVKKLSNSL
ncbi:MAG TPA: ABC transporter substrate-binding protein, partial [Flavobacteriaceae bacterium]|nr:ABC transporter substrate-binding protein [Flavobacteriaceae bacterium]